MKVVSSIRSSCGFTIVELLVVVSLMFLLISIGAVNLGDMRAQMNAGQDIRQLALQLNSLRSEAIRLRSSIRVNFNSGGYSWDYNDDGTTDGSQYLNNGSAWQSSVPASFVFNGLGLARGIGSGDFTIVSGATVMTLNLNQNGFISY